MILSGGRGRLREERKSSSCAPPHNRVICTRNHTEPRVKPMLLLEEFPCVRSFPWTETGSSGELSRGRRWSRRREGDRQAVVPHVGDVCLTRWVAASSLIGCSPPGWGPLPTVPPPPRAVRDTSRSWSPACDPVKSRLARPDVRGDRRYPTSQGQAPGAPQIRDASSSAGGHPPAHRMACVRGSQ